MEIWEDTAIILAVRAHGENGAIVTLLTENHGKYSGYVHGGQSSRLRAILQIGNIVAAEWKSRINDSLGQYKLELIKSSAAAVLSDKIRLQALQSACIIANLTLADREICVAVFSGFIAFLENLELCDDDIWFPSYIYWEIGLLRELGFGLDLTCCALTGEVDNLAYVSPKTGRAASFDAAYQYREKLLELPNFLVNNNKVAKGDISKGLKLTGYFLQKKLFEQIHKELPKARLRLEQLAEQL